MQQLKRIGIASGRACWWALTLCAEVRRTRCACRRERRARGATRWSETRTYAAA